MSFNGSTTPWTRVLSLNAAEGAGTSTGGPCHCRKHPSAPVTPEHAARLEALRQALNQPCLVARKNGLVIEILSPAATPETSALNELKDKNLADLAQGARRQQLIYYLEKTLHTRQVQAVELALNLGKTERIFQARMAPAADGEVVVLLEDITEVKNRAAEILEITRRERTRIGQDLHDGLGQHLTGISFLSRALQRKLSVRNLPEAAEAAEIGRLVLQAISQTRNLARGILPVELESEGLAHALRLFTANAEQLYRITCTLEIEPGCDVRNRSRAVHLFRLTQEAVTNSVKHGHAKRVQVSLTRESNRLVLCVRDDGCGFDPERVAGQGLGLRIMNYRAQRVGGTLSIQPGPEGGTEVICRFPDSDEDTSQYRKVLQQAV